MAASATGHPCRLGSSGGTHTFDVASPNAPRGLAIIGHVVTRVELGGRTRLVALEPNLGLGTRCGEQPTDLFAASIELIDGTSEFPTLLSTVEARVAALGAARLRSRGAELSRRLRAQLAATGPRPTDDQISTEDRDTVEVRWIADRRVARFAFIREVEQRVQLRDKTGPVATQGPSWTVRSITLVDVDRRGDLAATDLPIVVERRSGK